MNKYRRLEKNISTIIIGVIPQSQQVKYISGLNERSSKLLKYVYTMNLAIIPFYPDFKILSGFLQDQDPTEVYRKPFMKFTYNARPSLK